MSQRHNRRDRKITDKEEHIKKDGEYEVWQDIDEKEAYKMLFSEAQEEYNAKQKRADRRIEDYYEKVKNDSKKHTSYEMIVGVYDNNLDDATKKAIYKDFYEGWKERNPNLVCIGAYYHNDEEGGAHLHIDYIPIANGYKKGMATQSALVRALEQQGIESGESIHETSQILWEKRENALLEQLCNERGIEVQHNDSFTRPHMSVSEYKNFKERQRTKELQTQNDELQAQNEELQTTNDILKEKTQAQKEAWNKNHEVLNKQKEIGYKNNDVLLKQQKQIETNKERIQVQQKQLEELKEENIKLQTKNEKLKQDFNELAQEFNKTLDEFKELKGELER